MTSPNSAQTRPSVLGDAAVRGVGGILESAPQIPGMWQKIVDDYHRELLVAARQTQTLLENIHPSRTLEQQLTIMLRDRHTRPIAQLAHKYGAQAPGRVRAMVKQFLFQPPNTLTCPVTSITVTLLPNRGGIVWEGAGTIQHFHDSILYRSVLTVTAHHQFTLNGGASHSTIQDNGTINIEWGVGILAPEHKTEEATPSLNQYTDA